MEETCGLVLYVDNEGSRIKTGNQIKPLKLELGIIFSESRNSPRIEDKKEFVLHVEDVREKQEEWFNGEFSKNIFMTFKELSNNN